MKMPYICKKNILDLYETKCAKGSVPCACIVLKS